MSVSYNLSIEVQETVGRYEPEKGDRPEVIERKYFGQGLVYKNWKAYQESEDQVCYIPELSDSTYTKRDFMDMCNGQKEFADELFDGVDWQHPETLMNDWFVNNEWVRCECGNLINYGDGCNDTRCPKCRKEIKEDGIQKPES